MRLGPLHIVNRAFLPIALFGILAAPCLRVFPQEGKSYDAVPVKRPQGSAPQFPSPVSFSDVTDKLGISFRHDASTTVSKYLLETMGGGVALLDYDNDGRLDIFFTNGARLEDTMAANAVPDKSDPRFWNRLYRQRGDSSFEDVTQKAGVKGTAYGFGAAAADYDDDGFCDLFVTGYGGTALLRNNGNGTFADVTRKWGIKVTGWPASAGFFDFDKDGRLDLFVTRYLEWDFKKGSIVCGDVRQGNRSYCHPDNFKGTSSLLFHQNSKGFFEDVSELTGISRSLGKALGVSFADLDDDGWTDIFVANDNAPQQAFRNLRNGKFEDIALGSGLAMDDKGRAFAGMGVDTGDYNNDGKQDLIVTAFSGEMYPLYRNVGDLFFDYVTGASGVGSSTILGTGWGVKFSDVDNDGKRDLIFAQGHVSDVIEKTTDFLKYKQPLLLLRNTGNTFQNISEASGSVFSRGLAARGMASGDLDNDGDIDFVIAQTNGPPIVLRNNGTSNHWVGIDLRGKNGSPGGSGAKIIVIDGAGSRHFSEVSSGGSYLSSSDPRVIIGLGTFTRLKRIEIRWPTGGYQALEEPAVDMYHSIQEK